MGVSRVARLFVSLAGHRSDVREDVRGMRVHTKRNTPTHREADTEGQTETRNEERKEWMNERDVKKGSMSE